MLADGSIAEYGIGIARFKINGRERPRPVVFGPDDWYLLAASTLEIFNLRADSANGRLAPEEWLSLSSGCRPDFVMDDTAPIRPTAVAPREGYRIWLRYSDGVSGEVDLSHPAGRGVFAAWADREFFESVRLAEGSGIAWGDDLDLCPDALYMQITGKSAAEIMPGAALIENA